MGVLPAVLWKELTQIANRRRFRFQMLLAGAGMAFLFVVMGIDTIYNPAGRRFYTWEYMARFGFELFAVGSGLLAIFACLGALASAAAIVSEDYVKQRLPILLATPLDSLTILSAKLGSVLARSAAVVGAALPVFAVIPFFGGVELSQVCFVIGFLAVNLWFYASLGLFFSVVSRKTGTAVRLTVLSAIVFNFGLLPFIVHWGGSSFTVPRLYLTALSPFVTFVAVLEGAMMSRLGAAIHLVETVALGAILFSASVALFRPLAIKRLSGGDVKPRKRRRERKDAASQTPGRTSAEKILGYGEGVIGKELCGWRPWKAVYSLGWFVAVYVAIFIGSILFDEWSHWFEPEAHYAYFCAELVGFFLLLTLSASGLIASERERRTLQPLLLTRLDRKRILLGKAAALLIRNWPAFLWLAAHLLLIRHMGGPRGWRMNFRLPLSFAGLVTSTVFSITLGLYFSTAAVKERMASLAALLTWFFGAAVALWIAAAVADSRSVSNNWVLYICAPPVCALLAGLALALGRKRGHGVALAFAAYVSLALVVLLAAPFTAGSKANPFTRDGLGQFDQLYADEGPVLTVLSLPISAYSAVGEAFGSKHGMRALVRVWLPLVLFAWMAVSVFWSFETQAKKE